jgi:hypothetical protein
MPSAVTGFLCLLFCIPVDAIAQLGSVKDTTGISAKHSEKYISDMGSRSAEYQARMEQGTEKYLAKLQSQEQALQQQLAKVNPAAAVKVFDGAQQQYDKIQNDLKNNSETVLRSCGKYVPGIDSAITSLKFLQQSNLPGNLGTHATQVQAALTKVQALEDQFKKTDNVEDFIKQREAYLQQQLSSFNLPGLQQYNLQAAYYGQTMNELKADWEDPSRAEAKAVSLLNKLPAFQTFMQKNSMIAGLFNIPADYSTAGLAGLQTKDQVQQIMQQSMSTMGPGGAQTASQNIGNGQSALTSLRNKINQGSGSDLTMPDGQGNNQHTKSLFRRLEYGVNVQSAQSSTYFPGTTDFALTVGYKINDKSIAGIGVSYNVGWGTDIQHIHITSQGIGLRSYLDMQLKASFYASGGLEENYNKVFTSLSQVSTFSLWQPSALIGISKIISLKGNFAKKTKVQILWDMLSYDQIPKTQPFVFRVGYSF